jgi:hypothetical protein
MDRSCSPWRPPSSRTRTGRGRRGKSIRSFAPSRHYVESLAVTILPALYTALTVGLVYLLALESSEVGAWLAAVTYDHACSRMVRDTRIRSAGGNWNTADAAGEIGRTHARFRYKDLSAGPVPQDRWPSFLKFSPGIVLPVKVLTVQHLLFQSQISYVLEYR